MSGLDLDLSLDPVIGWPRARWFLHQGVPAETVARMTGLRTVCGRRAPDGRLDRESAGNGFLAFFDETAEDVVFWCPRTDELATWRGRAFALGEDNIGNAGTYAFDTYLHIYPDPLAWLIDGGRGIVVVDWTLAFDMLRDAPRVAVDERLLPLYRRHMAPSTPDLAVLANQERMAA